MPVTTSEIEPFLQALWNSKGTDLLITAGSPPLIRVDGVMEKVDERVLEPSHTNKLVEGLLGKKAYEKFQTEKELDFSFTWRDQARFRSNVFLQRGSAALAMRLIPLQIPSLDELGLPPVVESLVSRPKGLILVTGPTGGGKSTTLASMIDYINKHRACHILTIEDPIEYLHHHNLAAVNQREVGEDSVSFARALRSALREDPDVLLVGEMRDLETIRIVLTIAETGHLVFATLHTNDTAQAVDRIVDVFPGELQGQIRIQLAGTLSGVIYQQLIPKLGGGRVAAFEVMVATHSVRNLIKEGKTRQLRNVVATSQDDGMQTFEMALSDLIAEGLITRDDALARTLYPGEVTQGRGKRHTPTTKRKP